MHSPRWLSDNDMVQNTIYFCACNVSQQALYELFNMRVPESQLAKDKGTTQNGTGHSGIITGITKEARAHSYNVTVESKKLQ